MTVLLRAAHVHLIVGKEKVRPERRSTKSLSRIAVC